MRTPGLIAVLVAVTPLRGARRDLPVADAQAWVSSVELDVDAAGGQCPVVEMAPVGVVERLGELADHLHAGVDG